MNIISQFLIINWIFCREKVNFAREYPENKIYFVFITFFDSKVINLYFTLSLEVKKKVHRRIFVTSVTPRTNGTFFPLLYAIREDRLQKFDPSE